MDPTTKVAMEEGGEDCSRNREASKKSRKRRRERENKLEEDIALLEEENRKLLAIKEENAQLALEGRQLSFAIQERRGAIETLRRRRKAVAVQQFEMLVSRGLRLRAREIAGMIWEEDVVIYDAFERKEGGSGDAGLVRRGREACLSWWCETTASALKDLECTIKNTSFPRGGDSLLMEWRMTGTYAGPLPSMQGGGGKCVIDCVTTFCFREGSERISAQYISRSTTGLMGQLGVVLGPSPRTADLGCSKWEEEEQEDGRWPCPLPKKRQCIQPIPMVDSASGGSSVSIKLSSQKYRASKVVKALQASEMQRILSLYSTRRVNLAPASVGLATAA